ncbi:NAD(P)/FAD-dependent oxidoreductase [Gallaecimonas mangrovi]|uniref:NAD(P)/FAD-dependent oxidoreductase n=1 Tax=Gallaecimonas mangrovi TaxID=2291597 RepID=UPI000E20A38C|nr:FAD-dependent oxidoreductase [Gallaecimonas mangrovi]
MKRICVIGSGFAALTAIKTLRKHSADVEITLIAPAPEFHYYPSLIWVPAGLRSRSDIVFNIQPLLTKLKVNFQQARVTGLSEGGRCVHTDRGDVYNEGLLIASGSRFIKKLPGIEHALTLCDGITAAESITARINQLTHGTIAVGFGGNPNEPAAVRGGPMFELLFGLDTLLRRQGKRQDIDLVFFNPATRPGGRLGEQAVERLLARMKSRNIKTYLGAKPLRLEATKVVTEATEFHADVILFMPGMTGPSWLANSDLPQSPGGLIKADENCRVPGFAATYVVGDSGSFPGPEWAPKQAHMADLMASAASHNLLQELAGNAKPHMRGFKWELLCIIDMLDSATLVYRSEKRQWVSPNWRLLHWAKRFFEWWYLRGIKN